MKRVFQLLGMVALVATLSATVWAWPSVYPTGTTVYDSGNAFDGYTLFAPMDGMRGATDFYDKPGNAYLIDMNGEVVHQWKLPFPPGLHVKLLPNGHLLATGRTDRMVPKDRISVKYDLDGIAGWIYELDWDGKIVFKYYDPGMHHDFEKLANGNYLFVSFELLPKDMVRKVRGGMEGTELKGGNMACDKLVEVSPEGKVVWEWHAYKHADLDLDILGPIHPRVEWLHINDIDERADGNLVFSARHTDSVMVLDRKTGKIKSRFGNVAYLDKKENKVKFRHAGSMLVHSKNTTLGGPHDGHEIPPGLPGAGHIMVYDNGMYTNTSRALEFDAEKGTVVWESTDFQIGRRHFSSFISGVQRLPNGDTLICSGANGRFFEITPDNKIVWEYVNPYKPNHLFNSTVFRAHRYAPAYCAEFSTLPSAAGAAVVPPDVSTFKVSGVVDDDDDDDEDEDDEDDEEDGPTMHAY
ncbi:aryl-sulfate sulfotransferase [Desulfoluna sp.]|uniref:aryl-sulfate sulfotransferase n=1 Tax=Desulfoluna sp. TaxID=2045199 RepID=UPI002633069F|nr:aryl-sulfate sulfotransferase [Desulfoluna sp.]